VWLKQYKACKHKPLSSNTNPTRKKERKKGRKEGRKERRKEGRKGALEIRSPETTGVTNEDTEIENYLSKEKFSSAEGCIDTQEQHAQRGRQAVCPSFYS
jgi:hypothetical protein